MLVPHFLSVLADRALSAFHGIFLRTVYFLELDFPESFLVSQTNPAFFCGFMSAINEAKKSNFDYTKVLEFYKKTT